MQHLISKQDLHQSIWKETPATPLAEGHVRLQIDAFALTANNVTYATFGDAPMFYWNFFKSEDPAYGRVPVWGFATVTESNVANIEVGKRVYGYLPISKTLDVEAAKVSPAGFMDGAAHRKDLSPIYNTYVYNDADPSYKAEYEAQQMLFRPLYLTGWMICDCVSEANPKAESVVISSASSKTALAAAHSLKARGIHTIGLTSAGNRDYVAKSGLYAETYTYDEIENLPKTGSMAYVDFVGRPALTSAIHNHYGEAIVQSLMIGATDWEADRTPLGTLPGAQPELFFVPSYMVERAKQLAPGELNSAMMRDLISFYPISADFVAPDTIEGEDAIAAAWVETLDGKVSPTRGLICKF